CPSGQLQNLSLQACSWSGDGQRKDHGLAGAGAAAGAAAVAAAGTPAAGAPGTWTHAPEASPPSSATLALYRFHNFMVWFPLLVRDPRGGPDAPAVVWAPPFPGSRTDRRTDLSRPASFFDASVPWS